MRRLLALAASAVILLAGCSAGVDKHRPHPHPSPSVSRSASSGPSTSPSAAGLIVANGHGWNSSGLLGGYPAGPCRIRHSASGEPLPDPSCTLGVIDSAVNDPNIAATVCRKGGYTGSVRPPVSLTEPAKKRLLAAYGIPESQISNFELDHLVPLNSGGASDVRNLWPEPNNFQQFKPGNGANDKDVVETYLWREGICAGRVKVSAVQRAMASDWSTAVASLGLPAIPANYVGNPEG